MATGLSSHNSLNAPDQTYEVAPLELFFDLVFVFAVSQLSHHLLELLSWRGVAETLVLLLAVFNVWYYTSWEASVLRVDRSRTLGMVLTAMLLGLFMNAAVSAAFTTSGWGFVISFLLIQLGRTFWTLLNAPNAVWREHYIRALLWLLATSPLWIVGAAVNSEARLLWWTLAAGLDLIGTWQAHPFPGRRLQSENIGFAEAGHMLERCRLFLIIALGETVLTTGTAIAGAPMTLLTVVTGTAALTGTVALWGLAFGGVGQLIVRHVEETRDPIRATRLAGNALMVMVAGLIAVAVANEQVIAHPNGHPSAALSLLLFGGPVLFLIALGWYLWIVPRIRPRRHLIGSAALALVGLGALTVPPYVALMLAGVILVTLAIPGQVMAK